MTRTVPARGCVRCVLLQEGRNRLEEDKMDPVVLSHIARIRQQELLKQAERGLDTETWYLFQRVGQAMITIVYRAARLPRSIRRETQQQAHPTIKHAEAEC
jgi:hypothetical protein